ncbi:neural proliferation differentiation and control protein 1-like [Gadus chalcogrammus]|uniref:neural proliferation differentiation and control protein 1-like n=1 Tax=Gadus chalcogrammus TaxID=1042646 RepID=UPI0024C219D2|nr:neural proliferation differentiation and control protein 1-like [Gadus chalcogrammus]
MLLSGSAWSGYGVLLCMCACWLLFGGVSTSVPVKSRCHHLVCAEKGRHFCKAGSSHCGSCLSPLVENKEGLCVAKPKHHRHGTETVPELDQEIDFLHSVIEEKEVSVTQPKRPKVQVNTSSRSDTRIFFDAVVPDRPAAASPNTTAPTGSPPPRDPKGPTTPAPQPRATALDGRAGPRVAPVSAPLNDILVLALISLFVAFGIVFLIVAGVCFFRLRRESRLAKKADYPGFKGPGTVNGTSHGDANLQMSAQMYHYQHQKQQMMSMGKHQERHTEQKVPDSEMTSDEEEIGGDFTVYECPGLAPTGEMEVKNPLFDDSPLQYQGHQK